MDQQPHAPNRDTNDVFDAMDRQLQSILNVPMPEEVAALLGVRIETACHELTAPYDRSRGSSWTRSRRYAVWIASLAAVLLVGLSVALLLFRGSDAWAQVVQAVHARPWMHGTATTPEGEKLEFWLATSRGLAAFRYGQFVHFCDLRLGETYQYDPGEQRVIRLPLKDFEADEFRLMEALLTGFLRGDQELKLPDSPAQLVRQQRREIRDDGRNWLEYKLEFHNPRASPNDLTMIYRIDPATGLPREMTLHRGGAPSSRKFVLDYPDSGPTDVYALGVPRDAELVDRVPQGDLQRILAAGKVGRQQIGPYAGVILRTSPPRAGKPMDVVGGYRIWRDRRRWRIERVWQEDLFELQSKIRNGTVTVPTDSEAAALAWWKKAVQAMPRQPLFVSDGKTAYRFKVRFSVNPNTNRQEFQVEGAEPDYLALDASDPQPSMILLPEYICFPPMGLPSARMEAIVEPAPTVGPADKILVAVRETGHMPRNTAWRYWVDPQHGYASVRTELEDHGHIGVDVVDQFKQSPQGTWYAYKVRRGSVRAAGDPLSDKVVSGAGAGANETTATTRWYLLDFDAKLPDELFAKPDKVVARTEPTDN